MVNQDSHPRSKETGQESSHQLKVPSLSLPKSGGAIRGIGEKFAANPVTGTGSFSIPIATSPNRSSFDLQLNLLYDSGSGNGPFGLGWHLSTPSITRKTDKGLPRYREAEESDVFILSGAEDLVPIPQDVPLERTINNITYRIQPYRPRIEGLFARIERWTNTETGESHWHSFSKDNILTIYGKDKNSRIFDPTDPPCIFSWLICETRDDKGNTILYQYKSEDDSGVDRSQTHERNRNESCHTNRYLKIIRYGNLTPLLDEAGNRPRFLDALPDPHWLFEVVFDYGEHNAEVPKPDDSGQWRHRSDPFSNYRAGFEVRTRRLCQRVLMFHHIPGKQGCEGLVRSTDFTYTHNATYTFLSAVTQSGYKPNNNGYIKRSLPPVEFEYTQPVVQNTVEEVDPVSLENLPSGVDGSAYQWIDLHGESIPGILIEQAGHWFYKRNLSPISDDHAVAFAPLEQVVVKPNLTLANGAQFMDLAGDGQPDLVMLAEPVSGLYEHDEAEGWQPFRPFTARLNRNLQDPNLKFIDLDGDGHADVLITEDEAFIWHAALAEAGFGPAQRVMQALDEEHGPRLVFADASHAIYLADFSGDGLTDLVRIRNGEVCYWPNLGYGRFGAKVTMDNAPWFDQLDQFDQKRIRLADIDGSGTTDIIYLHRDGVCLYFNQSGNCWDGAQILTVFPQIDDLTSIVTTDLLGNGTACLVWSSPLPGHAQRSMRYVNLMGEHKPHLLVKVVNNLGAETQVQYASSTKFYLQDKRDGKPWITRLPFPVHVVEQVATYDHISRNRFVTRYAYHHGYFDGEEREFRGFGRVEQWDTETFAALTVSGELDTTNQDAASHMPPVLTKTWFHPGIYTDRQRVSNCFADEYYREPGLIDEEAQQLLLDDTVLPEGLTVEEAREACRTLKGSMLRQEIYALDGTDKAEHPYTVTEQNFTIERLQTKGDNRHGVFFTHARETIHYHYERNPADPRIQHTLTLAVDAYGNVLKAAAIGYGRRLPDPLLNSADQAKQTQPLLTYTENQYTHPILQTDAYRTPLPSETRTYELSGFQLNNNVPRFSFDDFALVHAVSEINYEEIVEPHQKHKRLIEQVRTLYRKDDLSTLLELGQLESLALLGESYQLAFTPGLLTQVYDNRITDAMLADEGKYVQLNGKFGWWIPSGQAFYAADNLPPEQELNFARQHFFLPHRYQDPFGAITTVGYDHYDLALTETQDALNNKVTVVNDYRVLQPYLITDPNGNRAQAVFDALGLVVGTAVLGKNGESDNLNDFVADLDETTVLAHLQTPLANPQTLLQQATTRLVYDLFAYVRSQKAQLSPQPAVVYTLTRETHVADLEPNQFSKIQHHFSYSDGFEREIQKKIQAEPDPVIPEAYPRWVSSGWTIFNNKGKPVRQYEPFFSASHAFEFGVQVGVSPVLFYDPLERVVATLHPNHTYEKVIFNPWQQITWDVNDTVLSDPRTDSEVEGYVQAYFNAQTTDWETWWVQRQSGALGAEEQEAAAKAAVHAETPTVAYFDTLGRPFLTVVNNGLDSNDQVQQYATRVILDIEGNQRAVIDAKDRIVMRYDYDLLSNRIHQASMEAGERWHLNDVAAKPIYQWNSRGHRFHNQYDALRRPVAVWVSESGGTEKLIEKMVYGESQPQPEVNNLRGQVYQVYDGAGVVTNETYDFKGNLLQSQRQIAVEYKTTLDWSQTVALETEVYQSSTRYDALNRPVTLTTPDNSCITPNYNEANLLERVAVHLKGAENASLFVENIDYNAKGQRERIKYGNGVKTHYTYDEHTYRLIHLQTLRGSEHLQDLYYTYDPVGNITRIRDQAQQTIFFNNTVVEPQADYTYDALYRLINASGREHIGQTAAPQTSWNEALRVNLPHPHDGQALRRYTERYQYDEVGNILELIHQASQGNWTRRYRYEEASQLESGRVSNRLSSTAIGETTEVYGHDVHGNMTAMPHLREMVWDVEDQLQVVDLGGGGKAYYVYDAAGQRVRKVVERQNGTRQKERIYLGGFEIYREYGGSEAVSLVRESLHVMDDKQRIALVEMRTLGEDESPAQLVRYQLGNHLGSASLELDAQGLVISYEEYYPYGSTAYQGVDKGIKAAGKRYRYTGKERDEETGLYYHGARYYACWMGRWTAADPIGIRDGVSLYVYVRNNPINLFDPTGQEEESRTEQPWWHFTEAGFQYQTGRHDIFKSSKGNNTGSVPLNYLVNSVMTIRNICAIPFNALTEAAALPEEVMRFFGVSEQNINATNFALMMTPFGEVNTLSTGLRSIQTTKKITKVKQFFKKVTQIGNEVINKAKRIIGEKIIRKISNKASKIGFSNNSFIRFVNKYDEHIVFRDFDVPRKRGIGGAHNKDEFFKYSNEFKVEDVVPHPTLEGIETIRYRMAALDKTGNPTGQYRAAILEKTVYDPSKISDKQFLNWGRQAAAEAQTANRLNREWVGTAPNGLEFRGYLDDMGAVKSFFPNF